MLTLSIIIPAYNEENTIAQTVTDLDRKLTHENIDHEIVVVNDSSRDNTAKILENLTTTIPSLQVYSNSGPNGFGYAIRVGLEQFKGDCVAIMMADLSDSPDDLIKFYAAMVQENVDCVFGSRFIKGGATYNYPKIKLLINRLANLLIRICFRIKYNDVTNAFKLYKRETIQGLKPFLAPHFNLTIELPLKAIVRGYSYTIVPNSWHNKRIGKSNLNIKEMGSRYLFILLYVLIEKFFSRNDFKKK